MLPRYRDAGVAGNGMPIGEDHSAVDAPRASGTLKASTIEPALSSGGPGDALLAGPASHTL